MKRIKWIVALACFLLVIGLAVAVADSSGTTGDLSWNISGGVLTISGTGAMPDYDYDPATPGGKYDDPEPEWCSTPWWNLTGGFSRIEVGEGVTKIGAYAFYGCYGVTQVSLPSTLTEIRAHAFEGDCHLIQVTFPQGLVTIGSSAFYQTGLEGTVTLPDSLETLGYYALNCRMITEIVFGSGLKNMDQYAVPSTAVLTSAAGNHGTYDNLTWCLAGHVLLIKGSGDMPAFTRTAVTYKGDFSHYDYSMPWYEWELRGQVTRVMVYSGITSVSANAFRAMSNLTSAALPYTVTSIGSEAFCNCSNLASIMIPGNVTSIGAGAFEACSNLQQVDIPSGVTAIPGNAFYGCSALKRISIPVSVTNIGQNAFYGCNSMEEVLYDCTSYVSYTSYTSYAGNWSFITFNGKDANPMAASKKAKLYCSGYLMGEVHLNSNSPGISPYAYYECTNNFRIVANGGYGGEIGEYAFYNCSGLSTADLPTSVSVVNQYAFYGCSAMSYTYQLFDGLTYIGDHAFSGCSALTSVNQNYYSGHALAYLGVGAFENCTQLTTVRMNMSGGTIREYAFYMCSALNSVTFLKRAPDTISAYAFDYSSSQINYYDGASWEGKVKNYAGTLTWKAVGGPCGANAAWKVTDESCLIISGSGEVTAEAWQNESGITGLVIGDGITGAANISFSKVAGAKQGAFDGGDYWVLTPAGVLHVFGSAAIPDMEAGHETWQNTVTDARIHEGVTKIGANAFHSGLCTGMTNIRFPGTLTAIRQNAFEGCAGLTDLYFPDPVPTVFPGAFTGVTANAWYLYSSQPGTISSGNLTWRTYCAWENGAAVLHELEAVEALEPTCTENGLIGHWHCTKCGNLFEEENAVQILEEEDVLLAMTGHRWTTEPSFVWADNGKACEVTFTCLSCGLTDVTEAEISGETAEEPTDTEGGVTEYTATAVSPDEKTYTDKKRVADLPARFTWSGTTITKYNLAEEHVIIPAFATELGAVSFKNCASIKSIIIPDSVTAIGPNTFGGCSEELTICSSEGAYAHTYALSKGIKWELYKRGPVLHGWFGLRDSEEAGLNATAEYFVAEQIGLEAAEGVLYSTDHLFTWEIRNMDEVALLFDAEPAFTVSLESGNVAFTAETFTYGNEAGIEVRMTEMPAAGTAEFKAVCTIGDETFEQTVAFKFTGIDNPPVGLEGDLNNPKIMKIGDEIPFCPQISFADGWFADGGNCGSLYGAGDEFFDLVNWQDECRVAGTGVVEVPLVAYSANLYMEKTVTYIFVNADGTLPANQYIPTGTVIKMPAEISTIGSEAFAGTHITEADIPAGTEIADDAFAGTGLIAVYTHNDEETIEWAVNHGIVALTDQ